MTADPHGPILPALTESNRPFWEACAAGRLELQVCRPCGHVRYPISGICPRCLSPEFDWTPMSGRGEILSWVVFQRQYHPAWAAHVPYNVVLVQLDEGPRMLGNVLPLGRRDLSVGDAVRVAFDPAAPGLAIPRWEPVAAEPRRKAAGAAAARPAADDDGAPRAPARPSPAASAAAVSSSA
jgi:uncharacterized OB-fold protein